MHPKAFVFPLAWLKKFHHTFFVCHNFTISHFIFVESPKSSLYLQKKSAKPLWRKIKIKDSVPIIAMMYSLASSVRIYCRTQGAQVLRGLPGGWRQSRRNVGSACCHTPWQGSAHTKAPVESLSHASFSASLHSHTANSSQALQRRLQWTFHTLSSTTWWRFKKEYYSAANLWVKKSLL